MLTVLCIVVQEQMELVHVFEDLGSGRLTDQLFGSLLLLLVGSRTNGSAFSGLKHSMAWKMCASLNVFTKVTVMTVCKLQLFNSCHSHSQCTSN